MTPRQIALRRRPVRATIQRQALPQTLEGSEPAVRARLIELLRAGDLVSAGPGRWNGSRWIVPVVAFAAPPKPARAGRRAVWVAAGVAMSAVVVAAVMVVGWLLAHLAQIVAGAVLLLAVWFAVTRINHGGVCPGLHCSGCKGSH